MESEFLMRLLWLPLWIISLTVHEFAHAWSAYRLGDDTAARMGRMTLNPVPHIDPFGTLLLPILGVPFAWAKPVPINPVRFRRGISMAQGMAITAAAGPIANLVLALLSAIAFGVSLRFAPSLVLGGGAGGAFLQTLIGANIALAVFNMIPIPPLDGSRIMGWLLPRSMQDGWHQLERYSPFLMLAVFWLTSRSHFLSLPIEALTRLVENLVIAIAIA